MQEQVHYVQSNTATMYTYMYKYYHGIIILGMCIVEENYICRVFLAKRHHIGIEVESRSIQLVLVCERTYIAASLPQQLKLCVIISATKQFGILG